MTLISRLRRRLACVRNGHQLVRSYGDHTTEHCIRCGKEWTLVTFWEFEEGDDHE